MGSKCILLAWSSGKDSAWALHCLQQDPDIEVVGLLTTINTEFDRIAMHAVRHELLEQQANTIGIELWTVGIPKDCSNIQYEEAMGHALHRAYKAGINAVAFGDLFLQDIRKYREKQFAESGIRTLFPLWMQDTGRLAQTMQQAGIKARVTCIDPKVLAPSLAGLEWNAEFIDNLPEGIDPCGENGEFHTFVYDGPIFPRAIAIQSGKTVTRDGFVFADLLPG